MYLHKISIDKDALDRERKTYADAYLLHQKMWELVSRDEDQRRDFLYRVEYNEYQRLKCIYLLSTHRIPSRSSLTIAVSPEYKPKVGKKERLYFKMRANPIVKRRENGKPKEYGLVMDAKHRFERAGQTYLEQASLDELVHDVCMKWLTRKGERHGFSVRDFEVAIDNGREFLIKSPGKRDFMLRTHDFTGVLEVVDPDAFVPALYDGIGSAKAFGCGLMLVKRV